MTGRPHVIRLSDVKPGWSEPFPVAPMLVRNCSRCGALVLDGMTIVHDLWHKAAGQ